MPRKTSLSIELLETFVTLHRLDGDAAAAAIKLNINQPSMSKRLSFLQNAGPVLARPWLNRDGKTWRLTEEGATVLPAVEEILHRYRKLQEFVHKPEGADVAFACGQEAAATFVHEAVKMLRAEDRDLRLRLSILRGEKRIEGVANGSLDLATVTHEEDEIREIARRSLYMKVLRTEHLVLVCLPRSPGSEQVLAWPEDRPVKPKALENLPLILPEAGSSMRKIFDRPLQKAELLHTLNIVLEGGGWPTLLDYVKERLGVAVVTDTVARTSGLPGLITRPLDARLFPPMNLRLIARRKVGSPDEADLSPPARKFHDALLRAIREQEGGAVKG